MMPADGGWGAEPLLAVQLAVDPNAPFYAA